MRGSLADARLGGQGMLDQLGGSGISLPRFFERVTRSAFGDLALDDLRAAGDPHRPPHPLCARRGPPRHRCPAGPALPTVADALLEIQRVWDWSDPRFAPEQERAVRRHIRDYTLFMLGSSASTSSGWPSSPTTRRKGGAPTASSPSSAARPATRTRPYARLAAGFERYAGALAYMRRVYFRETALPWRASPPHDRARSGGSAGRRAVARSRRLLCRGPGGRATRAGPAPWRGGGALLRRLAEEAPGKDARKSARRGAAPPGPGGRRAARGGRPQAAAARRPADPPRAGAPPPRGSGASTAPGRAPPGSSSRAGSTWVAAGWLIGHQAGILESAGGPWTDLRQRLEAEQRGAPAQTVPEQPPWSTPSGAARSSRGARAARGGGGQRRRPPSLVARGVSVATRARLLSPADAAAPAVADAELAEQAAALLDLPELGGWFVDPAAIREDAVALLQLRDSRLVVADQIKAEREAAIVDGAVAKAFPPAARTRWARRLGKRPSSSTRRSGRRPPRRRGPPPPPSRSGASSPFVFRRAPSPGAGSRWRARSPSAARGWKTRPRPGWWCMIPGIRVGHATDATALTGCTVILPDTPAVGGAVEIDGLGRGRPRSSAPTSTWRGTSSPLWTAWCWRAAAPMGSRRSGE